MGEIEDELIKHRNKSYSKFDRPYVAYITFEQEEGAMRALALNRRKASKWWGGQKPRFTKAPEPTDIIWEHGHYSQLTKNFRFFITFFIISLLLVMNFILIFFLMEWSLSNEDKYGGGHIDCDKMNYYDHVRFQDEAIDDYLGFYVKSSPMTGVLECFCDRVR